MKKGDIVRVYEDPITQQMFEGYAKIIQIESESRHQYKVKFSGTAYPMTLTRFIYPELTEKEKTAVIEKVKQYLRRLNKC